ncbi:PAS domain-containing protein [Rhizobiaceae bacterium BDR2-2]|uniref:PAS domain-containing protein n=1 Tax=Ectorhizobium quercum TaxID=2965071 RepID=A0AAE3N2E9_9HYPH|nr:PAS domain-containing protein [Ectorhizobium quercum]MCX8999783.1 PAS domain-containing protein [Ectorhizobium quercum]
MLIELFWSKYADLKAAVETNDSERVEALDREIGNLLGTIFQTKAKSRVDINRQFRLAIDLLNEEADDLSCVHYNSRLIQGLVERYIVMGEGEALDIGAQEDGAEDVRDAVFNTSMLDSISERVAVIGPNYRLTYTNAANASRHNMPPGHLVGKHFAEIVGFQRFQNGFKEHIDRCLAGETVTYTYADEIDGRTIVVRCRMSPFYNTASSPAGVMLVMRETADRRRRSSAA